MKKLFGKVLVGAAGFMMALGINAYAANVLDITAITPDKTAGTVTVSGTITGDAAAPEATILVVPEGVSLATVEDAQIKYIDQETAQDGKFSFVFKLEPNVKYTVYCGGTDITTPGNDTIDLTETAGTKYKIIGTVKLIGGANVTKVTATAGETSVNADETGTYTLEVAPGTYDVVVGRPGYLYRTFKGVEVATTDRELGETTLVGGDIVVDEQIGVNLDDLMALYTAYNKTSADADFNAAADLDDSGDVSLDDLMILLTNYNTIATDYDAK